MIYREDNRKEQSIQPVRIIACGVFSSVLEQLKAEGKIPGLNVTCLPSNLHINPDELKQHLIKEIIASQKENERIICLYGECFKDIDILCKKYGIAKIEGHHCYEIFLGRRKFLEIMDDKPSVKPQDC